MTTNELLEKLRERRDSIDLMIQEIESLVGNTNKTKAILKSAKNWHWTQNPKNRAKMLANARRSARIAHHKLSKVKWTPERRAKFIATMKRKREEKK